MFQVLASSGVRTAIAETRPFSLPQKPRRAYILSPQADSLITEGEPLTFRGGGFSSDFGRTDLHEGVWGIVKGEVLGTGFEFVTRALPVGRHEIKLTVPDGVGGIVSTSSYVEVRARKTQKFAEPAASEAP